MIEFCFLQIVYIYIYIYIYHHKPKKEIYTYQRSRSLWLRDNPPNNHTSQPKCHWDNIYCSFHRLYFYTLSVNYMIVVKYTQRSCRIARSLYGNIYIYISIAKAPCQLSQSGWTRSSSHAMSICMDARTHQHIEHSHTRTHIDCISFKKP